MLRGIVPPALCERAVAAIAERTGLDYTDRSTWDPGEVVSHQAPVWGHQALWDVRQHPPLHQALADIWGIERLWVSVDSCNFTPPVRPGVPEPLSMHWDLDPRGPSTRLVQGVLALVDTPVEGGGFRCAPSWRNAPERWPDEWPREPWGEEWRIDPPVEDIVQVPAQRGDLIVWESSTPHGTVANTSPQPRVAFYVSMFPAGGEDEARQRVADFEAGMMPAHARWKPGHDVPEPEPRAALTGLGERLLGRVAW